MQDLQTISQINTIVQNSALHRVDYLIQTAINNNYFQDLIAALDN